MKPAPLSLAEANSPDAVPLRRWIRQDERMAEAWVAARLFEANVFCGSHASAEEVKMWAEMVTASWPYSCEGLVQALSDGIRSGKIYGRLTYPVISEWLNAYEGKIAGVTEAEAARHKFRDNGGKDYLDRLEAGSDAAKARAANERVRQLEQKLRTDGKG